VKANTTNSTGLRSKQLVVPTGIVLLLLIGFCAWSLGSQQTASPETRSYDLSQLDAKAAEAGLQALLVEQDDGTQVRVDHDAQRAEIHGTAEAHR